MTTNCSNCKGEGFVMIDETPEDCENCDGVGEVMTSDSLFEACANISRNYAKLILSQYPIN